MRPKQKSTRKETLKLNGSENSTLKVVGGGARKSPRWMQRAEESPEGLQRIFLRFFKNSIFSWGFCRTTKSQKAPQSARKCQRARECQDIQRGLERASTKGRDHKGLRESQKSWGKSPKMDPKLREATRFPLKTLEGETRRGGNNSITLYCILSWPWVETTGLVLSLSLVIVIYNGACLWICLCVLYR